jgi:hypothetical protein
MSLILKAQAIGTQFANGRFMHVAIERLYDFVMGRYDLEDCEQSHLIRCDHCIQWLDACVTEKIAQLLSPLC